jgi:SAM-dependent methyltransferase
MRTARRLPEYGPANRSAWETDAEPYERRNVRALRREGGRAWGLWRIPERTLRLLDAVEGQDVLELGCGAAWWSIALARDGARVVGLDFSAKRLAQARDRMRRARIDFPLVEAAAETLPFPADRFDLVLSDYGATTFSDPLRTIPEVARVLRVGGTLVFAHANPFRTVAENWRADRLERRLLRPYFGLRALRRGPTTEFQLPFGEWIELFGSAGLRVERLVEPPASRTLRSPYVGRQDEAWARDFPMEAIWKLRKVARRRAPGRVQAETSVRMHRSAAPSGR